MIQNLTLPKLPIADWVESLTSFMTHTFSGFFTLIQSIGKSIMDGLSSGLLSIPPLLFILLISIVAFLISNKKWGLTGFTFIGLLFILNQGLWTDLMNTLTLVLVASIVSVTIGVPLGILMAKNRMTEKIIAPILDFMQTMPSFVYLIPAVAFFGIGMVPGVFASVIFALPPTVRFTNLGIRQVPTELVEASDSFGGTNFQRLIKLELPLAKGTILAGINQTTMLSLSMVVIASMIGAPGLGRGVLSALQRAQVGNGFVNGVALVILAIIIDRFTQNINKPKKQRAKKSFTQKSKRTRLAAAVATLLIILSGISITSILSAGENKGTINLSYVEWDSEVASTHVVAEVLKEIGYNVNTIPLDNAIMWESIAKGESDAMVSAWLPSTHKAQFEKYKDQIDLLGPNLEGAKLGLVVPSYMDVNSIDDLDLESNRTITGIEPGAGVVKAAENTINTYQNLSNWQIQTSSSGAMVIALDQAIKNKEPIVITGWSPHWMFSKYDLKFLDDPKQTMGETENINTAARKGLKKDKPKAYTVLKNFHWESSDIESVMKKIQEGSSPEKAAKEWIKNNPDKVAQWEK